MLKTFKKFEISHENTDSDENTFDSATWILVSFYGNFAVALIRDFFDNTRLMKILAIVLYLRKNISGTRRDLQLSIVTQV